MEPPPLSITATSIPHSYADSSESSPRSCNADPWDDPFPQVPGAKLRLMCSYGGHIIPRPHDKSLCYVGGETRIIVVDRHASLADLCSRVSLTLLNGRPFTLKYQLLNEDLDSLISVTTDEDLDNMIEEYERTTSVSPLKPSRLRLFLFVAKPETSTSMGNLLDDAKSETWFVDALNGAARIPRGLSDSATMDCLLNLDGVVHRESCNDLEEPQADTLDEHKRVKSVHDLHSIPDSPMVENNSSYGSSSSSPSMSNLPPIRVRVDDGGDRVLDQKGGMEQQFALMSVAGVVMKPNDGFEVLPVTPPLPTAMAVPNETTNRISSDDERSDHGAPVEFRKPPLPLQPVQHKAGGAFNLHSPDSVASDTSITSANSFSKHTNNQDPASSNLNSDQSYQVQIQQLQDSAYMLPPRLDQHQHQHQFLHSSACCTPHTATGQVAVSPYYPMYAPPQSQQQFHQPMDQQYQVYMMPVSQTQQYNMSTLQSNIADSTVAMSTRALTHQNSAAYKDSTPPIYPNKTASTANSPLVQIPLNQYQKQYVTYSHMHNPAQSISVASSASSNYGFEYSHPAHDQVYYTQHSVANPPLPSQYQTMNQAAIASLSDASKQLPTDNTAP